MNEAMTPKGWIVQIERSQPGCYNILRFAGQNVGGWTDNGHRGNTTMEQALEQADATINAFAEEITGQRSRGLGTETASQGVLL